MKMNSKTGLLLLGIIMVIGIAGVLLYQQHQTALANRQAMIHENGSKIMPFDLNHTSHIFKKTLNGGIQQVVIKDIKDNEQIPMIRLHLQREAQLFQKGNFSDPSGLHGEEMPGLKELSQGAENITISYADLPNGAQISYSTKDTTLINAIHQWFDAQTSDHGNDAMGI